MPEDLPAAPNFSYVDDNNDGQGTRGRLVPGVPQETQAEGSCTVGVSTVLQDVLQQCIPEEGRSEACGAQGEAACLRSLRERPRTH